MNDGGGEFEELELDDGRFASGERGSDLNGKKITCRSERRREFLQIQFRIESSGTSISFTWLRMTPPQFSRDRWIQCVFKKN